MKQQLRDVIAHSLLAISLGCSTGEKRELFQPTQLQAMCPTFYLAETGDRIMAEGFSSSVSPALEDKDLDSLFLRG